ncbi:MAG: winged helix-turn-helix transcriptional regulator [Clostridia bacterium]|nr:winged helix-turn-helix transcriptional regulator [Clostridia bacterium]
MKSIQIRTADEILKGALEGWWVEFEPIAPKECALTVTDLDTVEALGTEGEITLSRHLPCTLKRPFSFDALEAAISGTPLSKGKRLVFSGNRAFLDGTPLALSDLEFRLLSLLEKSSEEHPLHPKELSLALFSRERTSNQINVYIRYLRKKTDLPGKERLIHTLRGRGFYLKNER